MIFDIIEQKIVTAGLGTVGESLFRSFMPAECAIGVMSRVPLEGLPVDPHMPGRYKGRMQIITRHTDPIQGAMLASKIAKTLEVWGNEYHPPSAERGRATISLFIPETLPIQFPRLKGDGIEWSQHFNAVFAFENL